ncbi:SEL1-like repeat-containing protein kinase family protein [Flectobacillus longus]|uniref:SEL1-like repeat-containing protein kinase family protein n=1 Tax=Flectobacillus longus TaxID=2984207 RepID=UPI0024B72DE4|nr:protein kinase [Flectobacillus longus]MDI9879338.1 protein kinase [Flectobacillus longus]
MDFKSRYIYNLKEDLIGRGGFARVYVAKDTLLDRTVAIKVFNKSENGYYTVLEEIKKVIKYEHPNLIRYYDVALLENVNAFGEREELQIGIMELANAGDLKTFVQKNPESPLIIDLFKQVLEGLGFLHKKGIIHRDLKPQNILLVKDADKFIAKISDFGISRNIEANTNSASMTIGTIEYMAPEQFSPHKYGINGKISTNVDLWSFGIMLYELLAAEPPFGQRSGNTTAEQIMNSILSAELPQKIDSIEEPFKSVIKKCLVADAKLRVQDAEELIPLFDATYVSNPNVDAFETQFINYNDSASSTTQNETLVLKDTNNQNTLTLPISSTSNTTQVISNQENVRFEAQSNKNEASKQDVVTRPVQQNNYETQVAISDTSDVPSNKIIPDTTQASSLVTTRPKKSINILSISVLGILLTGAIIYFTTMSGGFYEKIQDLLNQKQFDEALQLLNDPTQSSKQRNSISDNQFFEQIYLSKRDTSKALPYMQQSLENNNNQNAYLLGQLYYSGRFVKQDFTKAKNIFEKIPTDDRAMTMLGNLYFMGLGVAQNYSKAVSYYQDAANKGNSVAMYSLGLAYLNGAGIKKNKQKALDWFYKVIQKNDNPDASNAAKSAIQSLDN